ncbi:MAG: hypothetical protein WBB28_15805 [Crinalium sp.]
MNNNSSIQLANNHVEAVTEALERYGVMVRFVKSIMQQDVDYGVIPGTNKPTLLKPGAEKLCSLFHLTQRLQLIKSVEDFTGKEHNGEPFFYYHYRAQLWKGNELIAEGDGSCNSWEKKYRYREAKKVCPRCQQPTIRSSEREFYCWTKQGGCGAKFPLSFPSIVEQKVGLVPNPEIFDQINTIQKMAQKRAFVGAVLLACNASEFFTQDLDDLTEKVTPVTAEIVF